jgi:hypothetical protein
VTGGHSDALALGTRPAPGVKRMATSDCPSPYVFCIEVVPGNSGPYVESSSTTDLYNAAYITRASTGKIDKKFKTYFSPDPGNPTYQYIDYKGKAPKKLGKVKFSDYYCIGFSPSACDSDAYTFIIGIALAPAT